MCYVDINGYKVGYKGGYNLGAKVRTYAVKNELKRVFYNIYLYSTYQENPLFALVTR